MSIVTTNPSTTQLRCLPLFGISDSFRYVQMLNGAWEPINHDDTEKAVGEFSLKVNQGGQK